MSILNLDNVPASPRGKKINGKFLVLGLVALAGIGTTLAGSITLNSSQSIEFGQAVARTASCDTDGGITVAPTAKFSNTTGGSGTGSFNLGTISITGIDDSCEGKVFTIKGYDDTNQTPVNLITANSGTPSPQIRFQIASSQSSAQAGVNVLYVPGSSTSDNRIDVGPASDATTASATQIMKLTIESSAS